MGPTPGLETPITPDKPDLLDGGDVAEDAPLLGDMDGGFDAGDG